MKKQETTLRMNGNSILNEKKDEGMRWIENQPSDRHKANDIKQEETAKLGVDRKCQ